MVITIIPAKPLAESKTRLAPVLPAEQRVIYVRKLLTQTIQLAKQIGDVVVVTRDPAVGQLAHQSGVYTLIEKQVGLNAALCQGITWANDRDASGALILPLDLPLLTAPVLEKMVKLGRQDSPGVVIAPCRRHQGTNALFLRPPDVIVPHFGQDSFAKHQKLCQQAGITPIIYEAPELAFDLDTPEDWHNLLESHSNVIPKFS